MTKEEVRVITLAKARIKRDNIIWDIGAGTGSISVEAAFQADQGRVYAIERENKGVELIRENKLRFGLDNIEVIYGKAPEALNSLPSFDRAFIGGNGGSLRGILELCNKKLKSGGRIVINAITLNTIYSLNEILPDLSFEIVDFITVNVSRIRKVKQFQMWQALNPVYIITMERG